MTIQIKTKLHADLASSLRPGEVRVDAEYTTGPRNLLKAFSEAHEVRAAYVAAVGNIGAGHTWIEIDGRVIELYETHLAESLADARHVLARADVLFGTARRV